MLKINFLSRSWLLLVLLPLVTRCTSGERAQPIDLPAKAVEIAVEDALNNPLFEYTEVLSEQWWELFEDEQLTQFIDAALAKNPPLQAAQAKVYLAKAVADRTRATLYPNLSWGGDILREKLSETGLIPFGMTGSGVPLPATGGIAGIPVYFTQYETELNLSYDFDIWGKNRSTLRAAIGEMQSKIADEAFVRLQLGISIAQTYFRLQVDYKRQDYAQALVENKSKYLNLIKLRVSHNIGDERDVQTSETNFSQARQKLLQIQSDIAIQEFLLKTYLADQFEEEIFQSEIEEQPLPKVPLPTDLSLNLLGRRPDIVSQLWIIESAGYQIKAAKAGFYPDFSLTGLFGYQTIHPGKLFQWPSSYFNIDPAFNLPIFDGGRLTANLRSSEVNYDLAIFNYNELVLNAIKEVLTSLSVLQKAERQWQEFKNIAENQNNLLMLTQQRMTSNLNSDLDYLISEENLLVSKDQLTIAFGNTIEAILSLIKSLGGGYGNCN
jgi:NodT family efflux transporter outer membrane factor (OMF) lipoprotein